MAKASIQLPAATRAALAKVTQNLKRLQRTGDDQRIARRNARRAAFGALRSLRHAVAADFPAPRKPKPPTPPRAPQPAKPPTEAAQRRRSRLPHRRFGGSAMLFTKMLLGPNQPFSIEAHEFARQSQRSRSHNGIAFAPGWSERDKWLQLFYALRDYHRFTFPELARAFIDFHNGAMVTSDLVLAAEYQELQPKLIGVP